MPVISTRRYSSSYLTTPSSTTSSSVGSYRSNYSSTSSTSASKDLPSSSSRYNFSDSGYRSTTHRSSLSTSGLSSSSSTSNGITGSSYRSRYDFDDTDKKKYSSSTLGSSSSLSTRIGVSKTSSSNCRYNSNSDTLPPLPPTASSLSVTNAHNYVQSKRSLSRSRDQNDSGESNGVGSSKNGDRSATNGKLSLMNDLDFYEKYSPSRYMTKYEISRSRSLSEAAQTPTRDKSPSSSNTNNDTPTTHTPKSEVCQRNHIYIIFLSLSPCVIFEPFFISPKSACFVCNKPIYQPNHFH